MGLKSTATSSEIKSRYRQLCLKHHPDKNTNKPEKERLRSEVIFKNVQDAYAKIGTTTARRLFHSNSSFYSARPYSRYASSSSSSSAYQKRNEYDERYENFAQSFAGFQQQRQRGYHTSFTFDRNGGVSGMRFQRDPSSFRHQYTPTNLKSVHVQHVAIPLQDLYNGKKVDLTASTNLVTQFVAAFRGGLGAFALVQSMLRCIPIILRGRALALLVGCLMFHAELPRLDREERFTAEIPPGAKAGTKISFLSRSDPRMQVKFVLKEENHPKFNRQGNDLHAHLDISHEKAREGCVMHLDSLGGSKTPIRVAPGRIRRSGDTIRLTGEGWPITNNQKGDLILHFRVVRRKRRKSAKV